MRSIIWDLGGTLLDTYPDVDRALAQACFGDEDLRAGDHLAEVASLTRISSGHAIRTLAASHDVPERELRRAYDGVKATWRSHPAPVMAGAHEVMTAVHTGGGLNLVATHRDRDSARQLLEASDLRVDDLVCAPDGYARKPSPEMNRELLARHGLRPSQVVTVGDRPADVDAGRALGALGVLLVTPGIPLDAGDSPRITDLRELLDLIPD
jgi:HAD superfamily hydrolase (TIGR01509 family)